MTATHRNVRQDAILFNCLLLLQRLCAPNAVDMYVNKSELDNRDLFLRLTYKMRESERPELFARKLLANPQNVEDIVNIDQRDL